MDWIYIILQALGCGNIKNDFYSEIVLSQIFLEGLIVSAWLWLFWDMFPAISILNPTSLVSKFVNIISFPVICCLKTSHVTEEHWQSSCVQYLAIQSCHWSNVFGPTDIWLYNVLQDSESDESNIVSIPWLLLEAKELNLGISFWITPPPSSEYLISL